MAGTGGVLVRADHTGVHPHRPLPTLDHISLTTQLIKDRNPGAIS